MLHQNCKSCGWFKSMDAGDHHKERTLPESKRTQAEAHKAQSSWDPSPAPDFSITLVHKFQFLLQSTLLWIFCYMLLLQSSSPSSGQLSIWRFLNSTGSPSLHTPLHFVSICHYHIAQALVRSITSEINSTLDHVFYKYNSSSMNQSLPIPHHEVVSKIVEFFWGCEFLNNHSIYFEEMLITQANHKADL